MNTPNYCKHFKTLISFILPLLAVSTPGIAKFWIGIDLGNPMVFLLASIVSIVVLNLDRIGRVAVSFQGVYIELKEKLKNIEKELHLYTLFMSKMFLTLLKNRRSWNMYENDRALNDLGGLKRRGVEILKKYKEIGKSEEANLYIKELITAIILEEIDILLEKEGKDDLKNKLRDLQRCIEVDPLNRKMIIKCLNEHFNELDEDIKQKIVNRYKELLNEILNL